jgi:hypothetical protein
MQHFRPDNPRSGAHAASFGRGGMLALALACVTLPAHAVLGGLESGLGAEAQALGPEVKAQVKTYPRYRVHLFQPGSKNLTVRQYAGQDGRIFGVVWDGSVKPDLAELLGPYYQQYLEAAKAAGYVRGLGRVEQPDFVLRVSGHMRHYLGIAWVPSLLPAGVATGDIQ